MGWVAYVPGVDLGRGKSRGSRRRVIKKKCPHKGRINSGEELRVGAFDCNEAPPFSLGWGSNPGPVCMPSELSTIGLHTFSSEGTFSFASKT